MGVGLVNSWIPSTNTLTFVAQSSKPFMYFWLRELNTANSIVRENFLYNGILDEHRPPTINPSSHTNIPSSICNTYSTVRKIECDTLVSLYNSTNGGAWSNKTNRWVTDNYCNRYGVTCNEQNFITMLKLFDNRLQWSLPEWLNLPNITMIDIARNYLIGSFPEINAPELLTIDASFNWFWWSLPIFNTSTKIRSIKLDTNFFGDNDTIIPTLDNLKSLQALDIKFNLYHGDMSDSLTSLYNKKTKTSVWVNKLFGICKSTDIKKYGKICCWVVWNKDTCKLLPKAYNNLQD